MLNYKKYLFFIILINLFAFNLLKPMKTQDQEMQEEAPALQEIPESPEIQGLPTEEIFQEIQKLNTYITQINRCDDSINIQDAIMAAASAMQNRLTQINALCLFKALLEKYEVESEALDATLMAMKKPDTKKLAQQLLKVIIKHQELVAKQKHQSLYQ